jgi:hypothetical protein
MGEVAGGSWVEAVLNDEDFSAESSMEKAMCSVSLLEISLVSARGKDARRRV